MSSSNLSWILRIAIAVIFLQTLFYKFTGHPDSVHIFTTLGLEPYGRIGLGITEAITAMLLLLPKTKVYGIILGLGIIIGAIVSHLIVLGVETSNDGGSLFILALIVLVASVILLYIHKSELITLFKKYVP